MKSPFFPNLVMYSKVTGSSTVSLWDWHSTRTCLINTRASAVRPGRGREVLVRQSCLGTWVKVEVKLETCKWHQHMLIQLADLAHCSAILWSTCILQYWPKRCLNTTFKEYKFSFKPPVLLKFSHSFLLHPKDNSRGSSHLKSHFQTTAINSQHREHPTKLSSSGRGNLIIK